MLSDVRDPPPIWGVVPAAGSGHRFGGCGLPKQYLTLGGRTVLEWSVRALLQSPAVAGVVVILAGGDRHWAQLPLAGDERVLACTGGARRSDSVVAGLRRLLDEGLPGDTRVLVHDAVRPCLHRDDLARLLATPSGEAGAILALPVRDTLKRAGGGNEIAETVFRTGLWHAQTPQLFALRALLDALEAAVACGIAVTDEAQAMERTGASIRLLEGSIGNLKLTYAADLPLIAAMLGAEAEVGA